MAATKAAGTSSWFRMPISTWKIIISYTLILFTVLVQRQGGNPYRSQHAKVFVREELEDDDVQLSHLNSPSRYKWKIRYNNEREKFNKFKRQRREEDNTLNKVTATLITITKEMNWSSWIKCYIDRWLIAWLKVDFQTIKQSNDDTQAEVKSYRGWWAWLSEMPSRWWHWLTQKYSNRLCFLLPDNNRTVLNDRPPTNSLMIRKCFFEMNVGNMKKSKKIFKYLYHTNVIIWYNLYNIMIIQI